MNSGPRKVGLKPNSTVRYRPGTGRMQVRESVCVRTRKPCGYITAGYAVWWVPRTYPRRDDTVMISVCTIGDERTTSGRDTTYDGDSYRFRYQTTVRRSKRVRPDGGQRIERPRRLQFGRGGKRAMTYADRSAVVSRCRDTLAFGLRRPSPPFRESRRRLRPRARDTP